MKLKTIGHLIAAPLMALSMNVNAGFVDADWETHGDGLVSIHEETGIEWLSLTQTSGLSIASVQASLDSTYNGWRLPTRAEVNQAMNAITGYNTEGNGTITYKTPSNLNDKSNAVIDTFGYSFQASNLNNRISYGMYLNEDIPQGGTAVLMSGAMYEVNPFSGLDSARVFDDYARNDDMNYANAQYSVFLVSDGGTTLNSQLDPSLNDNNANAPSDAPVSLISLLPLIGFGLARRRKK